MSYENWSKTAVSEKTYQVSESTQRDVYTIDGITVYDHFVSPWNIFKPSHSYTVIDLQIPLNDINKKIVSDFGGEFVNWYCSDGYMMAKFDAPINSLKIVYNFIKECKNQLVF